MNTRLICRIVGMIALIVGASMTMSLPWSLPICGRTEVFDARGFFGLLGSIVLCGVVGGCLWYLGRKEAAQRLLHREAIAVVGLSWLTAGVLGACPFLFSGTGRGFTPDGKVIPMGLSDAFFESASGFSGTGASVLADVEDQRLVSPAVLFWRSQTHFLGGLGIIVLFVALLGLGSASKALLRVEVAAPSQTSTHEQTRRAAMAFGTVFVTLNAVLTLLLLLEGLSLYDALCHAFGTVATGGFSTHNASVGYFRSPAVELTIVLFMLLGCTNFALLYFAAKGKIRRLFSDLEFRVYLSIVAVAVLLVTATLIRRQQASPLESLRMALFQCVSIQTNTGFATADFNLWPPFCKGLLLVLMYIGGCAGSTSCSVKVIRYVFLGKIVSLELQRSFRPSVVKHIRLGGVPITDSEVLKDVLVYVLLIVFISVAAWLALLAIEPLATWTVHGGDKLLDCFTAVAATINGVGPGLGMFGPTANYGALQPISKIIVSLLMLLGRIELFPILVLFLPGFWSRR
ncbi:MAG: TrkH family potassium uptake protein [Thermogutta sp.]|nr:TrkH family potassium uptake protein [Thermogutta sp.]